MRIVIANCSVVYSGRGDTQMKPAVRAIILKEDGSVSIHQDKGTKALNYMGAKNVFTEEMGKDFDGNEVLLWRFDMRRENLTIHMHDVISDTAFELEGEDEGLIRDGTEDHLQEWLSLNPTALGGDYTLVQREFQTGAGPVDLLVQDKDGSYIAVEVKRVAMLPAVDQVGRYVNAIKEMVGYENVRGLVAALDVRPKTMILAENRGVEHHTIDGNWKEYRAEFPTLESSEK